MISLILECIGNITNDSSTPFTNIANIDRLHTSFNGKKGNNTTKFEEEPSGSKIWAYATDCKNKPIVYVLDSPLLNADIKAKRWYWICLQMKRNS